MNIDQNQSPKKSISSIDHLDSYQKKPPPPDHFDSLLGNQLSVDAPIDVEKLNPIPKSQLQIEIEENEELQNLISEQKLLIQKLQLELENEINEKKALQQKIEEKDQIVEELEIKQKNFRNQIESLRSNTLQNLDEIKRIKKFINDIDSDSNEDANNENSDESEDKKDEIDPERVTISKFNELCLNLQLSIISKIFPTVSDENISRYLILITNFLIYLIQFTTENSEGLEILSKSQNQLLIEMIEEEQLNVPHHITTQLFQFGALGSPHLIHHLNQFKKVSIEMKYPSDFFSQIYGIIRCLKDRIESLEIAVFVSGKKCMDVTFRNDRNIEIVRMDSSVSEIEKGFFFGGAFAYCTRLKKVTISPSVKIIGDNVFNNCRDLVDVTIPPSVLSIEYNAFINCSSLEVVVIPPSVIEIGIGAFSSCVSLKKVKIPNSVRVIESSAFAECKVLPKITIPSSVEIIEALAFNECTSLVEVSFVIPSSLTEIDDEAFRLCSSLKKITIPPSVTIIGNDVFNECVSLEEISIYPSLINIGKNAFPRNVNIIKV